MIVNVETSQAPDFAIFRQGLFINQLMGSFQAPMDHHQFLLPCPGNLRRFGREFPPSDLHGAAARFELIPQMECAMALCSNPTSNATPPMAPDSPDAPRDLSGRIREIQGIDCGVELLKYTNPSAMSRVREKQPDGIGPVLQQGVQLIHHLLQ